MKGKILLTIFIGTIVFISGCSTASNENKSTNMVKAIVFKSPTCGCCVGWTSYANKNGIDTETRIMQDMSAIKDKYNVPPNLRSCHTAIIGNYFIEGHVPMEAINKLLSEKPDIDGIALPGMPSGSAGMPGAKREEWTIYSVKDGKSDIFMKI